MRCPVCKTECGEADKCPTCGFDQLNIEFINKEEADAWIINIVIPYRANFSSCLNVDNDEYLIRNGILEKYKKKTAIM